MCRQITTNGLFLRGMQTIKHISKSKWHRESLSCSCVCVCDKTRLVVFTFFFYLAHKWKRHPAARIQGGTRTGKSPACWHICGGRGGPRTSGTRPRPPPPRDPPPRSPCPAPRRWRRPLWGTGCRTLRHEERVFVCSQAVWKRHKTFNMVLLLTAKINVIITGTTKWPQCQEDFFSCSFLL